MPDTPDNLSVTLGPLTMKIYTQPTRYECRGEAPGGGYLHVPVAWKAVIHGHVIRRVPDIGEEGLDSPEAALAAAQEAMAALVAEIGQSAATALLARLGDAGTCEGCVHYCEVGVLRVCTHTFVDIRRAGVDGKGCQFKAVLLTDLLTALEVPA